MRRIYGKPLSAHARAQPAWGQSNGQHLPRLPHTPHLTFAGRGGIPRRRTCSVPGSFTPIPCIGSEPSQVPRTGGGQVNRQCAAATRSHRRFDGRRQAQSAQWERSAVSAVRRGSPWPSLLWMCGLAWWCPLLPASRQKLAALPSVHEPVDDLCKKALSLCTRRKVLGIAAASRVKSGLYLGNTTHALCIDRTCKLSTWHAVITHKYAENLSQVYLTVIQGRNCETWDTNTVKPALEGKGRCQGRHGPGRPGARRRPGLGEGSRS